MSGICVVSGGYQLRGSLNFSFLFVEVLCSLVHAHVCEPNWEAFLAGQLDLCFH